MKKRTKLIALVMVLAFALTGVAYAAWTDNLDISGQVETGNLDVEFATGKFFGVTICPAIAAPTNITHGKLARGLVDTSIRYEGSQCIVTIGNLYPGAEVVFDLAQKNVGSIPVKWDDATIEFDDPDGVKDYLLAQAFYVADTNGGTIFDGGLKAGMIQDWGPITKLASSMNSTFSNLVLDPKGWLTFEDENAPENGDEPSCIRIKMDKDAPNEMMGKEITFTIDMNWKQFNK